MSEANTHTETWAQAVEQARGGKAPARPAHKITRAHHARTRRVQACMRRPGRCARAGRCRNAARLRGWPPAAWHGRLAEDASAGAPWRRQATAPEQSAASGWGEKILACTWPACGPDLPLT
eukprot:scaffold620_cov386-Prasinococcus_capsulatus_cf.AAC.4